MPNKIHFLKAAVLAVTMLAGPVAAIAQTGNWYSFQSKCNIEFSRKGSTALVVMNGKTCNGKVVPDKGEVDHYSVWCGKQKMFGYLIDEEQVFILNDQYQNGCEAAKLITMDLTTDPDLKEHFATYLANYDYILDDEQGILAKAKYMNGRSRFQYSAMLLDAFIAKHPDVPEAYLYLSDAHNGLKDTAGARKNYQLYKQGFTKKAGAGKTPQLRTY